MIRIYTKSRHVKKIKKFMDKNSTDYEIFTIHNLPETYDFDLGVSYCYPRKILSDELSLPSKGFINYHPAPLPEYGGVDCYSNGIKNQVNSWGVTVHYMDEEYDTGKIIKVVRFDLHEPPILIQDLGVLSHYFLFQLFKDTLMNIYSRKVLELRN